MPTSDRDELVRALEQRLLDAIRGTFARRSQDGSELHQTVNDLIRANVCELREALARPLRSDTTAALVEALEDLIGLAEAAMRRCGEYDVDGELADAREALARHRAQDDTPQRISDGNTLERIRAALAHWAHAAGWEYLLDRSDTVEIIDRMMGAHCDERSMRDLVASGGLPEASADCRAQEEGVSDTERLDAVLDHAHEIVCKIPGGIRCVDKRGDIDAVIAAYRDRAMNRERAGGGE